MFGRLLCRIGMHRDRTDERWTPTFDRGFVRSMVCRSTCLRCGRVERMVAEFDPMDPGRPPRISRVIE